MSQVVRYKKGKVVFEVLTEAGAAAKFREGRVPWEQVLVTDIIFKNQSKGERAKEEDLASVFGGLDSLEILRKIVMEGDLQVSSAERREALDKKKHEILHYLHRNFLDPTLKLPHPLARLEGALEETKFRVDPDAPASRQALDLIKALSGVLFFSKALKEASLRLGHKYVGACSNIIHSMAEVQKETYTPEGVVWELGIPPADFDAFVAALNKVTKGDYDFVFAGSALPDKPEEKGGKSSRGRGGKARGASHSRGKGKRGK
jgi:ribosome maturation protein SDO1